MTPKPKCTVPTCDRDQSSAGLCAAHRLRLLTTGSTRPDVPLRPRRRKQPPGQVCSVQTCDRPAVARGYCAPHRWRVVKYSDPLAHVPVKNHGKALMAPKRGY
jgi:hypothetical protein